MRPQDKGCFNTGSGASRLPENLGVFGSTKRTKTISRALTSAESSENSSSDYGLNVLAGWTASSSPICPDSRAEVD